MREITAVVVGNDHYNTLNVVRALGEARITVDVVIVKNSHKSFVLKSKYIASGCIIREDEDIVAFMMDRYGDREARIALIPTCDGIAAKLDEKYDLLSTKFILPSVGGTQHGIRRMMDKNIQLQVAKQSGFDVPFSMSVDLQDDKIRNLNLDSIPFPCIIKPEESIAGSKRDFRICEDVAALRNALVAVASTVGKVLIQEFIPNDEVLLIAGVRTVEGKNIIGGTVNKIKHGKKYYNLGLNSLGCLTEDRSLYDVCTRFVQSIDYKGLYSFEIVCSNQGSDSSKRKYFVEINLRTDGLMYFYTAAGLNYPEIWVRSCYGLPIADCELKKSPIVGMNEFQYLKNFYSFSRILTTIKDFFRTDTFSTFSIKDIKPFFARFIYR